MIHNIPTEDFLNEENSNSLFSLTNHEKFLNSVRGALDWINGHEECDLDRWYREECPKLLKKRIKMYQIALWYEIDHALVAKKDITFERLYLGMANRQTYIKDLKTPQVMAFMLRRPVGDQIKYKYLLDIGYERMEEVLEMDLLDFKKRPIIPLIKEVREIVKMIQDRLEGSPIQKIHESKVVTTVPSDQIAEKPEDVDAQLFELLKKNDPNIAIFKPDSIIESETVKEVEYRPVGAKSDGTIGEETLN